MWLTAMARNGVRAHLSFLSMGCSRKLRMQPSFKVLLGLWGKALWNNLNYMLTNSAAARCCFLPLFGALTTFLLVVWMWVKMHQRIYWSYLTFITQDNVSIWPFCIKNDTYFTKWESVNLICNLRRHNDENNESGDIKTWS